METTQGQGRSRSRGNGSDFLSMDAQAKKKYRLVQDRERGACGMDYLTGLASLG